MSVETRKKHLLAFKAKVAMAVLAVDQILAQLAQEFKVYPNSMADCKCQLTEKAAG